MNKKIKKENYMTLELTTNIKPEKELEFFSNLKLILPKLKLIEKKIMINYFFNNIELKQLIINISGLNVQSLGIVTASEEYIALIGSFKVLCLSFSINVINTL